MFHKSSHFCCVFKCIYKSDIWLVCAGLQSDHDHFEKPGKQRGKSGPGSAVWAVGRTVRRGVQHEKTGRKCVNASINSAFDIRINVLSVFGFSVRRCWRSTRRWWRIGTSTIRTRGWRSSSVRITFSRHPTKVREHFSLFLNHNLYKTSDLSVLLLGFLFLN